MMNEQMKEKHIRCPRPCQSRNMSSNNLGRREELLLPLQLWPFSEDMRFRNLGTFWSVLRGHQVLAVHVT